MNKLRAPERERFTARIRTIAELLDIKEKRRLAEQQRQARMSDLAELEDLNDTTAEDAIFFTGFCLHCAQPVGPRARWCNRTCRRRTRAAQHRASIRYHRLDEGTYAQLFRSYSASASKRRLDFLLTRPAFDRLVVGSCRYCGDGPSNVLTRCGMRFLYNGIDRLDNNRGYVHGNVCSCCIVCNRAKSTLSYDDFMTWISRVHENSQKAIAQGRLGPVVIVAS